MGYHFLRIPTPHANPVKAPSPCLPEHSRRSCTPPSSAGAAQLSPARVVLGHRPIPDRRAHRAQPPAPLATPLTRAKFRQNRSLCCRIYPSTMIQIGRRFLLGGLLLAATLASCADQAWMIGRIA